MQYLSVSSKPGYRISADLKLNKFITLMSAFFWKRWALSVFTALFLNSETGTETNANTTFRRSFIFLFKPTQIFIAY